MVPGKSVELVAVEDQIFLMVVPDNVFASYFYLTESELGKSAEGAVMVSWDIDYLRPGLGKPSQFRDYLMFMGSDILIVRAPKFESVPRYDNPLGRVIQKHRQKVRQFLDFRVLGSQMEIADDDRIVLVIWEICHFLP